MEKIFDLDLKIDKVSSGVTPNGPIFNTMTCGFECQLTGTISAIYTDCEINSTHPNCDVSWAGCQMPWSVK